MMRSLKCSTDQGVQNELHPHICFSYSSSSVPAWIVIGTGNSHVGLEMCCVSLCQPDCVEGAVPKFSILAWASDAAKATGR